MAERQGAAVDREIALEMKHRRDALDRFALRLPIETIDDSKEIQILADAEIAVERKFLRHIAKRTARLRPRGEQIETRHPDVAARSRTKKTGRADRWQSGVWSSRDWGSEVN